jgi:hypothetical protein
MANFFIQTTGSLRFFSVSKTVFLKQVVEQNLSLLSEKTTEKFGSPASWFIKFPKTCTRIT